MIVLLTFYLVISLVLFFTFDPHLTIVITVVVVVWIYVLVLFLLVVVAAIIIVFVFFLFGLLLFLTLLFLFLLLLYFDIIILSVYFILNFIIVLLVLIEFFFLNNVDLFLPFTALFNFSRLKAHVNFNLAYSIISPFQKTYPIIRCEVSSCVTQLIHATPTAFKINMFGEFLLRRFPLKPVYHLYVYLI